METHKKENMRHLCRVFGRPEKSNQKVVPPNYSKSLEYYKIKTLLPEKREGGHVESPGN